MAAKQNAETVTLDAEHLRERLERRLAALGKTARGVSREAGLGDSTLRNIMEGRSQNPRIDTISKLAEVLGVDMIWFTNSSLPLNKHKSFVVQGKENVESLIDTFGKLKDEMVAGVDPVLQIIDKMEEISIDLFEPEAERDGMYVIEKGFHRKLHNPILPVIDQSKHYCFTIKNNFMEPVFRLKDHLLVNRESEVQDHHDYVFYKEEEPRVQKCLVARLVSFDESTFEVNFFNPFRKMSLSRTEWIKADAILMKLPLFW